MVKRLVTVDIDASAIRVLQTRGGRVERWASAPLEPGLVVDGSIPDPSALGARVRFLMKASGIVGHDVVASLSGLYSVSRLLTLPDQPAAGAAAGGLAKQIQAAVPAEEMRLQWQIVMPGGLEQKVLVVGVPVAALDAQLRMLRSAGLAPRALELKGMALTRAVDRSQALIANVEEAGLDVVLVDEGVPQVTRTLAFPPDIEGETRGEYVAQAIRQVVLFYAAQRPGRPLSADAPLFLLGPRAENPALRKAVQAQLDYTLQEFAPALAYPSHLPVAEYAANLGLALRGPSLATGGQREDGADPIRINLMPARVPVWRVSPPVAVFVVLLAIGLAASFFLYQRAAEARVATQSLQPRLAAIERQVSVRRVELTELTQKEAAIKDFQTLVALQGDLTGIITKAQQAVPEGIQLGAVGADATTVTLSGSARGPEQAIELVNALRATGLFTRVDYTQTQTGPVSFALSGPRAAQAKK